MDADKNNAIEEEREKRKRCCKSTLLHSPPIKKMSKSLQSVHVDSGGGLANTHTCTRTHSFTHIECKPYIQIPVFPILFPIIEFMLGRTGETQQWHGHVSQSEIAGQ